MQSLSLSDYINPALLKLITLMAKILAIAHILACMWAGTNDCKEEMRSLRLVDDDGAVMSHWLICGFPGNLWSQYLAALYWTIATMMAVGYGEVSAQTTGERFLAMGTQLVGATAFGFIIVKVTEVVDTVDPHATITREKMDEIREYMRERQLPLSLQRKIRGHFLYFYSVVSVFREMRILQELPYSQRVQILTEAHQQLLNQVRGLRRRDTLGLVLTSNACVVHVLDYPIPRFRYFILSACHDSSEADVHGRWRQDTPGRDHVGAGLLLDQRDVAHVRAGRGRG